MDALAFTIGSDVFFGAGQYRPETAAGQKLIAHELTHTVQQTSDRSPQRDPGRIQRQSSGSQAAKPPITAQTIFPFPKGSRVVLNRLLADTFFGILSSQAPDVAQMLQAIEGQVATVTTATDDLFEASLSSAVNVPAQGSNPATSITGLTLTLRRQPAGTFDFTLTGQTNPAMNPPFGFEQRDLTATREGARIVLSSGAGAGAVPQLRVTPGGPTGQTQIEGFTAPFLSQIPDALRGIVPARIELLQLSRLPDVPVGTAAETRRDSGPHLSDCEPAARTTPTLDPGRRGAIRGAN